MAPAECCALCFSSEQIPSAPIAPNFRIFQNNDSFRASMQTIFRTSLTRLRHQHFPSASVSILRRITCIPIPYILLHTNTLHITALTVHTATCVTPCITHISAFTPHRWHYIGTTHHTHASVHTQLFYVQQVCTHHSTHATYNFIPHTIHIYMHTPHRYY